MRIQSVMVGYLDRSLISSVRVYESDGEVFLEISTSVVLTLQREGNGMEVFHGFQQITEPGNWLVHWPCAPGRNVKVVCFTVVDN